MQAKKEATKEELVDYFRQMNLIRVFEDKTSEMYMRGKIRGFLHLYIGQEAIAVGCMAALEPQDYIVSHYRDHGHALARGMDSKVVMAELYGKSTGCSGGKGGSMHLYDASLGFTGGYAIVGGQLVVANGLALASQQLKEDRVTVCFFGDGALNQGEVHEAMNLASVWKLPVLFYLENNLYGMGSYIERTHAGGRDVYKIADHYKIPARQIDGMDVLEVRDATREITAKIRAGEGPFFLEALTYRFRGHSMADPELYREKSEEEDWKPKDPIATFKGYLLDSGKVTREELEEIEQSVESEIENAVNYAEESPEPVFEDLFQNIYS